MTAPLVVGNWKMNGKLAESAVLAKSLVSHLKTKPANAEIAIAPPFTLTFASSNSSVRTT